MHQGGAKDEHFSCCHSSCQWGLSNAIFKFLGNFWKGLKGFLKKKYFSDLCVDFLSIQCFSGINFEFSVQVLKSKLQIPFPSSFKTLLSLDFDLAIS